MEIFFDPINFLLLLATISLFWWLRSILGQRNGFEKPRNQIEIIPPAVKPKSTSPIGAVNQNTDSNDVDQSNKKQAKPVFDAEYFLSGATYAHELILQAFANGEKAALKPLLTKSVFESFEKVIDANSGAGNTSTFKLVSNNSAKIVSQRIEGKISIVVVEFECEIISATFNAQKELIAGDDKTINRITDVWTFERETESRNPNWKLAATSGSTQDVDE